MAIRAVLLAIVLAGFAASSVLAAFSNSPEMLIASRALMGVFGATIAPSTRSLIFTMFLDPKQRSTAIGVWIAAYSAGGNSLSSGRVITVSSGGTSRGVSAASCSERVAVE